MKISTAFKSFLLIGILFFIACTNNSSNNPSEQDTTSSKKNSSNQKSSTNDLISFQVWQMPATKLKEMYEYNRGGSKKEQLRRIYFQFQAVSPSEFQLLGYGWCRKKDTLPPQNYCYENFLLKNKGTHSYPAPLTIGNLEWRASDIQVFLKKEIPNGTPLSGINVLFWPFIDTANSIGLYPVIPPQSFFKNDEILIDSIDAYVQKKLAAKKYINPCPPKKPDQDD